MDGVRKSMKGKGLREEDAMDRDSWRQQIVLGLRRTIVYWSNPQQKKYYY